MTYAHHVVTSEGLWAAWSWDPVILLGLLTSAVLYARGVWTLWTRGGGRGVPKHRIVAFYGGLLCAAAALVSPLDALSATLFSAHMVQHLLLILGVVPLLVYGAPSLPLALGLPLRPRRALARLRRLPGAVYARRATNSALLVWGINVIALWAWHLPVLYTAALRSDPAHALEHACFLAAAALFWALVIPRTNRRASSPAAVILLVFATGLQSGGLGAILTFAGRPLYPVHGAGASAWGISLLADQQLAGAIMWIPAGFVYLATMTVLFLGWMRKADQDHPRASARDEPVAAWTADR